MLELTQHQYIQDVLAQAVDANTKIYYLEQTIERIELEFITQTLHAVNAFAKLDLYYSAQLALIQLKNDNPEHPDQPILSDVGVRLSLQELKTVHQAYQGFMEQAERQFITHAVTACQAIHTQLDQGGLIQGEDDGAAGLAELARTFAHGITTGSFSALFPTDEILVSDTTEPAHVLEMIG